MFVATKSDYCICFAFSLALPPPVNHPCTACQSSRRSASSECHLANISEGCIRLEMLLLPRPASNRPTGRYGEEEEETRRNRRRNGRWCGGKQI